MNILKVLISTMNFIFLVGCQNSSLSFPTASIPDDNNAGVGVEDPIDGPDQPTKKLEVVNGELSEERALLSSFRYREIYPNYSSGQAFILSNQKESFSLQEEDIQVMVRIEEAHLNAMGGEIKIKASQQIWANLSFLESETGENIKICVIVQPKNHSINSSGDHLIPLIKKQVFTFLEGQHDCSSIGSLPDEVVENGITKSPFVVQAGTPLMATTQNDFKSNKKRVGVVVEFDLARNL